MRLFNRVTISLVVILFLVVLWDLVKPATSTLYTEAVAAVYSTSALGPPHRHSGRNRDAAAAFRAAVDRERNNEVAAKNLREIFSVTGDVKNIQVEFQPIVRAQSLTYPARVRGEILELRAGGAWGPVYLRGVG